MRKIFDKKIKILILLFFVLSSSISVLFFFLDDYDVYKLVDISKISFYSVWWYISSGSFYMMIIYLSPIFLAYASITSFSDFYHSGYMSYVVQRIGYKKTMICEIIKCKISSFILPLTSIILLTISRVLYSNNIIATREESNGIIFLRMPEILYDVGKNRFLILYILLLTLFSLFIINISIIVTKFIKNSYIISLLTLIIVIFIEVIGIFFVGPVLSNITGIVRVMNVFSIYNLIVLDAIPNLIWEFAYILLLIIISDVMIYYFYFLEYGGKND